MNVPPVPAYCCASKRASAVKAAYSPLPKENITDLVIDSIGLKVFGEGEWGSENMGLAASGSRPGYPECAT